MSRRSIFLVTLLCTCWIPLLLAVAAVSIQALRITGKPSEYSAIGRILLKAPPPPPLIDSVNYGTQLEILESGEIRRRALERVRALHPGLKEIDVEIRVTQTKGSSILNVAATGSEPKYPRVFLEAVLDEYVVFAREMKTPPEEMPAILQRPDPAVEIVPDLWVPLIFGALLGGSVGVILMFAVAIAAALLSKTQDKALPYPQ